MGMISDVKRKMLPEISQVVGLSNKINFQIVSPNAIYSVS